MSRFLLIPVETNDEPRTIKLPSSLIPPIQSSNPQLLSSLLKACDRAGIRRSDCGKICCQDELIDVNYDDFLKDSVNMKFSYDIEPVYDLLYKNGFLS